MSRIEILTIGDELTEGRLTDTNAGELSAKLLDLGLAVSRHVTVADDMKEMVEAMREAAARSDAVLVSGGLGPTSDDLTAEAAARAFDREIHRFDEALEHTRRFFTDRGREMPPTNIKQADLPAGSAILPNHEGTAVGFRLDNGSCRLYFMPGVPRELRRMAEESVLPDLERRLDSSRPSVATLKLFGLGESEVADRLNGLEELVLDGSRLVVQYRASFPEIHIRLVITGASPETAASTLEMLTVEAGKRLGHHVFAVGGAKLDIDFPAAVATALTDAGTTAAAAEMASGGEVARLLGTSDTGRQVLAGSLVATDPDDFVRQLDLQERSAAAAAEAVRRRFSATVGIAALGADDGSDGNRAGELIVAAVGPGGAKIRELYFPIDRDRFRRLAAYAALKLAADVLTIPQRGHGSPGEA